VGICSYFSQRNNCGSSIAPGKSCKVSVTFHPGATGTFQGTLAVMDNDNTSPQSVTLSGTGVTGANQKSVHRRESEPGAEQHQEQ
jgi:hypothetical protein